MNTETQNRKINYFWIISPFLLQNLIWIPTRIILKFFVHFQIHGLENLKEIKGGVVFAVNHSSELDPVLIPASFGFLSRLSPVFYTSRERSFYINSGWRKYLYGGLLFKLWGSHPVLAGINNYEKSLSTHIELLKMGRSVCIFPEGRKTRDGKIGEAKGGVAYMAWSAGVPIVPVAISGDFQLSGKDFFLRRRRIQVSFGQPIYVQGLLSPKIKPTIVGEVDDFRIVASKIMDIVSVLKERV